MDFKSYLKKEELSKTTINTYNYYLLDFISFLDKDNTQIEHCTPKEIMLYLAHLQKKEVSNTTKKYRLYALKHFFDYQIEYHKREDNPVKRIKIRGAQKQNIYPTLSPQELQGIYQNYQVPKEEDKNKHKNWFTTYKLSRERNKVIIGLFINQAITTAEASRILVEDIDLRQGKIAIRGGKIGKDRTLDLKSNQIIDLMEYLYKIRSELLKYQTTPTNYLFLSVPSSGETKATANGNLQIWKGLTSELKQQNPKFINLQQIRSSVIMQWLKQHNLRQVQYQAGHKHIISTEAYLINDVDDLQKEIENFHPIG